MTLSKSVLYGIDTWSEDAAARYAIDPYECFQHMSRFPNIGRVKEGLAGDVRVLGHGQHVIYYQIQSDAIMILRVVHARMDATHHLDF
jgi:toxin ParE1/3/4